MTSRPKPIEGGRQFNLIPAAAPVDTYVGVQEISKKGTLSDLSGQQKSEKGSMSELSQALSSLAGSTKTINDVLYERGVKQGQQRFYEDKNRKDWNNYVKENPEDRPLNPYIKVGYERARAKNTADTFLDNMQKALNENEHLDPQQFQSLLNQQQTDFYKNLREQNLSNDAIDTVIPSIETYSNKLIQEHRINYGNYTSKQLINESIISTNNDLNNLNKSIINVGYHPEEVDKSDMVADILNKHADYVIQSGRSEVDATSMVFESLKENINSNLDNDNYNADHIIDAADKVVINGKPLKDIVPNWQSEKDKLKESYHEAMYKKEERIAKHQSLMDKQNQDELESMMYTSLAEVKDPKDTNAINKIRMDITKEAIRKGLGHQIGDLTAALKKYTGDVRDLKEVQSDEDTEAELYTGIIRNKTKLNDIVMAYNNGLINYKDFKDLAGKLYDVQRDTRQEQRSEEGLGLARAGLGLSERRVTLDAQKQNLEIGLSMIDRDLSDVGDGIDVFKTAYTKKKKAQTEASLKVDMRKEFQTGGDGSRTLQRYDGIIKKANEDINNYDPYKKPKTQKLPSAPKPPSSKPIKTRDF